MPADREPASPVIVPLDAETVARGAPVIAALGDVRFVGGCVRDALLGNRSHDIDMATPLPPELVLERLRAAGIRAVPTGLAHGTVTAVTGGRGAPVRHTIEITTLRRDVACFGRHAEVAFTDDWQADAARRDFTINALSCTADGRLYDYFGGVDDLRAGRVRFIGAANVRIREDVLRLLRFFRFHARYGRTNPDAEAMAACQELAPLLPGLSGERVRAEVLRLLGCERCAEVWPLLAATGVQAHLLPTATRVDRLAAVLALESALGLPIHARALEHLAALLPPESSGAETISERLRLSREERAHLRALAAPRIVVSPACPPHQLRRALVQLHDAALFRELLLLSAAETGAPPEALDIGLVLAADWQATRFPLDGRHLLALGVPPGPAFGHLLSDLEAWWADQNFSPDHAATLAEATRRLTDDGSGDISERLCR